MATGIKDKVAIIGMGCIRFGERWDMGAEELMVEAFKESLDEAAIDKNEIDAAWLGTCFDRFCYVFCILGKRPYRLYCLLFCWLYHHPSYLPFIWIFRIKTQIQYRKGKRVKVY